METQTDLSERDATRQLLPRGVRHTLFAVLGIVLAGALFLITVRGEALLLDLAALRAFCF